MLQFSITSHLGMLPAVFLVLVASCGPSEELVAARASSAAAAGLASEAESQLHKLRGDISAKATELNAEHEARKSSQGELEGLNNRLSELRASIPPAIARALADGREGQVTAEHLRYLLEPHAEPLDAASKSAKEIWSVVARSGAAGLARGNLSPGVRPMLEESLKQALDLDRRASVACDSGGCTRNANTVDRLMDLDAGNSSSLTLNSCPTHHSQNRAAAASRGWFFDSRAIEGGGSAGLEIWRVLINDSAGSLAVKDIWGNWSDPDSNDQTEGDFSREITATSEAIDLAVQTIDAQRGAFMTRSRATIDGFADELPEAFSDACSGLFFAIQLSGAGLSANTPIKSIQDLYVDEAWPLARQGGEDSAVARFEQELVALTNTVLNSVEADYSSLLACVGPTITLLSGWQDGLDCGDRQRTEFDIGALTQDIPAPPSKDELRAECRAALLMSFLSQDTTSRFLEEFGASLDDLRGVATATHDAERTLLESFVSTAVEAGESHGATAHAIARFVPVKVGLAGLQLARSEFLDRLVEMGWHPKAPKDFFVAQHSQLAAARARLSVATSLLQLVAELARAGGSTDGLSSAIERALASDQALSELFAFADAKSVATELNTERGRARAVFLRASIESWFPSAQKMWAEKLERTFTLLNTSLVEVEGPGAMVEALVSVGNAIDVQDADLALAMGSAWDLSDSATEALQSAQLTGLWRERVATLHESTESLAKELSGAAESWRADFAAKHKAMGFANAYDSESSAFQSWLEVQKKSPRYRTVGTGDTPPQLTPVQVAAIPTGHLLVCTWPLAGWRSSSGVKEMSVLFVLRPGAVPQLLKGAFGPLVVYGATKERESFEVVTLFEVEEWAATSKIGVRKRILSMYAVNEFRGYGEGGVVYNRQARPDTSATRLVGGSLTRSMIEALDAVGIPSARNRGGAWTDPGPAGMSLRRAWSKLAETPSLETVVVSCDVAGRTLGAPETAIGVHASVGQSGGGDFFFLAWSLSEPLGAWFWRPFVSVVPSGASLQAFRGRAEISALQIGEDLYLFSAGTVIRLPN